MKRSTLIVIVSLFALGPSWPGMSLGASAPLFLGDTGNRNLNDADRKLQADAALSVLENPNPTSQMEWSNPRSGASGIVQTLGALESEDGLTCRTLQLENKTRGGNNRLSFPVCKGTDGEWFIASGMKLTPSAG
jgi:hypothetical protein